RWKGFSGLSCTAQIKIGHSSLLAKCERDSTTTFLLAGGELLDVDAPATVSDAEAEFYLSLAPWLIFLRSAYGEWCWHNPYPQAAWTIDDPLLKSHYGFLRYRDLIAATDAGNFTATIAFIPWNCDRNSDETIELFQSREDRLSICLHGCDHTEGEFC